MMIYLQSLNFELWNVVNNKYSPSSTDFSIWDKITKKKVNLNAKTMNALYCSLDKNEFTRIFTCTFAHKMWHTLEVTHKSNWSCKTNKN